MSNYYTWKAIQNALKNNIPVMLLYVLESKGSSPGRQGFCMAVDAHGTMTGSIGGGIMEHKLVELAKEKLMRQPPAAAQLKKQVHDKSGENQSGMICSGEQTILLYPVKKTDGGTIDRLLLSLEENKNGTLTLSPSGVAFEETVPENNFVYTYQSASQWQYQEKTGYKNRLFIVGGGHCSLALSALMRSMDFYITVYEDRKELKTLIENDSAHKKHIVKDYSELATLVPPGQHHYIVIMTFGYRTDDIALKALLHTPCRYLGVLGSKKKMDKLMSDYQAAGIDAEFLQKIYTPIGISINSRTPQEIAVSIAAEIIGVKNRV